MTIFLRVLEFSDKERALQFLVRAYNDGIDDKNSFDVAPDSFKKLPSAVFAYWISDGVVRAFETFRTFQEIGFNAQVGCSTKDDFRFLRLWWEIKSGGDKWFNLAKGGKYAPFYSDIHLMINWRSEAEELEAAILKKYPYLGTSANWVLHKESDYFKPGITWTRRTKSDFSPRVLPAGCVFSEKGLSGFIDGTDPADIFTKLAVLSSDSCRTLIEVQLAAADKSQAGGVANSYEVGVIKSTPAPDLDDMSKRRLHHLAREAWSILRNLDQCVETSHAFVLPRALLASKYLKSDDAELERVRDIQAEINAISNIGYGGFERSFFGRGVQGQVTSSADDEEDEDDDTEGDPESQSDLPGLLSWCVGVAFGHFDWRLATGGREAPPAPDPFEPLPLKCPGMLPDTAEPFHAHTGILVDDRGHRNDLAQLIEEVLSRVKVVVPDDIRLWLRREFFAFHLQCYRKSRRKAPIYWPLATTSGSYTLWVYYPSLSGQTLYTAINDFVEPKLKQVCDSLTALRNKGAARSRDDERQFEALQAFELELIELRDALLKLAPTYKPNHDDGVQISAAPLWALFKHKPWQKVLKETWAKLEKGEYDWAQLAMNYRPVSVREKCKTDKSLAIAHGLENFYIEPETKVKNARGKKKSVGDE